MLTTTNEASSVPAKRVDVAVDRGCRCGGMLSCLELSELGRSSGPPRDFDRPLRWLCCKCIGCRGQ